MAVAPTATKDPEYVIHRTTTPAVLAPEASAPLRIEVIRSSSAAGPEPTWNTKAPRIG